MTERERSNVSEWIERINTEGWDLTEWELGFMADITEQWDRSGQLSEKQIEIIERIYANKTP